MSLHLSGLVGKLEDFGLFATVAVMLLSGFVWSTLPAKAGHVQPSFVQGNPTCEDLGYDLEFKVDPPSAGTYQIIPGYDVTVTTDGTYFNWTSELGIDAVLSKGGDNANHYVYDPPSESFGDTGLHSPINPNNNQPFGLSHISFCYDLELLVTKTANTSFARDWDWTIDKSADQEELLLAEGESFTVNYDVTVSPTANDSDWAVSGVITIENPAPVAATINTVTDVVSPAIPADVDCGVALPHALAAGATLQCNYTAALPDGSSRVNTATVATTGSVGGSLGTADVVFGDPTTEIDECVDVSDTLEGVLGQVCADDLDKTFNYPLTFGTSGQVDVLLVCGVNEVDNTASFIAIDTQATGDDTWTVIVTVDCAEGCTLTQGYWKTHSAVGPAPFDDNWDNVGLLAESERFFDSGKTWYEVFWTPPKGGNPYYQLAHQYMAARLNELNGADTPTSVDTALSQAESLLSSLNETQIGQLKGKNAQSIKAHFTSLAGILGSYNEGAIGPGHCDE